MLKKKQLKPLREQNEKLVSKSNIDIDIQWAISEPSQLSETQTLLSDDIIIKTVTSVLNFHNDSVGELTIRFVDSAESQSLNHAYRDKDKPTNVLSFSAEIPDFIESTLLGDLIICDAVVKTEAKEQHKSLIHHYQHLIVHGTMHLLGFDHIENNEAVVMEKHEIAVLNELGIDDPYQVD